MSTALTLSLDEGLLARLRIAAAEREMTAEAVAEMVLATFLDDDAREYDLDEHAMEQIKAGLAEADRGEFASEEEMERIFSKYRQK